MKYSYFPGCSLKGLGRAYEESLLPVMKHLGVELQELNDWNCCGATAYMAVDETKACVLAARNLALAEMNGNHQLMAPCSACYLVLNKTKHYFHDYPAMRQTVDRALAAVNLHYGGDTPVRHPLDVLVNDVGLEAIKQKVKRPLKGLKIAPYYGCQIVRPYATFDDQYNPVSMDLLLEALGATVLKFPLKTKCCGGSLTGTVPEAARGAGSEAGGVVALPVASAPIYCPYASADTPPPLAFPLPWTRPCSTGTTPCPISNPFGFFSSTTTRPAARPSGESSREERERVLSPRRTPARPPSPNLNGRPWTKPRTMSPSSTSRCRKWTAGKS